MQRHEEIVAVLLERMHGTGDHEQTDEYGVRHAAADVGGKGDEGVLRILLAL